MLQEETYNGIQEDDPEQDVDQTPESEVSDDDDEG